MAISINKVSEELRQQIIQDYQNGKSLRQIEQDYDVTRSTVSKYLTIRGIKTVAGNHYRKYYHNENFFDIINSESQAYWLGFMFADGYIVNNNERYGQDQFGISVAEEDIQILYDFKDALAATNPIHTYDRQVDIKGQPLCRIQLTSQKTVDDLIKHGCVKQKSNILKPPIGVPNDLIPHFIRGLFDGDGSIIKTKNSHYKITDGYVYSVNFTTTQEMAQWLQMFFDSGSVIKEHRRDNVYYYSLGGHAQVRQFYHLLYDNATIYIKRKYLRFQELLSKYEETQGIKGVTSMALPPLPSYTNIH